MAATTGSTMITSAALQDIEKTPPSPTQFEVADGLSNVEESSATDAESVSSAFEGSDSESNAEESTDNIATDVVPGTTDANRAEEAASADHAVLGGSAMLVADHSPKALDGDVQAHGQAQDADADVTESARSGAEPSYRPLRAMPPPLPLYGRAIVPNGPAVDPYRGTSREATSGYRPKLLQPEDGRVTATVPHKLRGNLDAKSGNFATIHMDLPSTTRQERMSAAQRSSEATVAAAEKANQAALAAQRSSEAVVAAAERASRGPHPRPKRQSAPSNGVVPGHFQPHPPPGYYGLPAQIPTPHETKNEQARLLTLLKAIHPNSIVDQLCKGLAYFGGVPGAPPPTNGAFPLSARHNGSGALFVNWLSEIFPPVHPGPPGSSPGQSPFPTHASNSDNTIQQNGGQRLSTANRPGAGPHIDPVILPKRKRGRPKGSKSSRPRKDKGIKKGPNLNRISTANENAGQPGVNTAASEAVMVAPPEHPGSQSAGLQSHTNATTSLTPSGKRRGRPPGSKNKPKPLPLGESNNHIAQATPMAPNPEALNRSVLPDDIFPATHRPMSLVEHQPRSEEETPQSGQMHSGHVSGTSVMPAFPSPPGPATVSVAPWQAPAPRKRKLSTNAGDQASHDVDVQSAAERANSQGSTNLAGPQKRSRPSGGIRSQDRAVEGHQKRSPPTSTSVVAPSDTITAPASTTPASSFEGENSHGGGQDMATQARRAQNMAQNISPVATQPLRRPSQQQGVVVATQVTKASSQPSAQQQPNRNGNSQLPKSSQVPQNWQRAMVGPQQTANPDAQPVAQHPRSSGQSAQQQQRR